MSLSLELPNKISVSDLCDLLDTYLDPTQVKEVYRAYLFSAEAHEGQMRKTGEAYIFHPLAVTYLLGLMHMDVQTLCAALLHDVIEDTHISKEKLAKEFGDKVAELVDGVSKLSSVQFQTREQAQAASFQKMLLAMSRDIRVIIIKLADRLHNMRTLNAMSSEARHRIARETLEIYAPLANRLGINIMCIELEELSFAILYPWRYQVLEHRLHRLQSKRNDMFVTIQNTLEERLHNHHINAKILKRGRHYYGIYCKMQEKKGAISIDKRKTFSQVTNMCVFGIIVDTTDACYRTLGVVHNIFKPICERFKDYIAIPKANGYQSLHTILFSSEGLLIEVQIRTAAMHELSEIGIIAHGWHKLDQRNEPSSQIVARQQHTQKWLTDLINLHESVSDAADFFNYFKAGLISEDVYVFTPQGKIMQLPHGATALDFAYAIHSDVGHQCIAAKVDNQYVSLSAPLSSGQTVEVITATWARPNPSRLNIVVTARARYAIRQFLRNLQRDEAILLGKRMLDRELSGYSLSIDKLTEQQQAHLLKTFKLESSEKLLIEVGLGNIIATLVAHHIEPHTSLPAHLPFEGSASKPLIIKGTGGILVNLSRCCYPIPGDEIVGFLRKGRGIIIHRSTCKKVIDLRHSQEQLLPVEWEDHVEGEFVVEIRVEVRDKRGVLAAVASAITHMGSNIESVSNDKRDGINSMIKFCIAVKDRNHLASIVRHLRRLEMVIRIHRSKH